jgi:hypothetical protein
MWCSRENFDELMEALSDTGACDFELWLAQDGSLPCFFKDECGEMYIAWFDGQWHLYHFALIKECLTLEDLKAKLPLVFRSLKLGSGRQSGDDLNCWEEEDEDHDEEDEKAGERVYDALRELDQIAWDLYGAAPTDTIHVEQLRKWLAQIARALLGR